MATRLVYHDLRTNGGISPFDEAIVSIAQKESVRLVCPYLSATYLRRVSGLTASWKLLTDVEEWLGSQTRSQRSTTMSFIADNRELIRHIPRLHAKVIIGSRAALVGSANFTDAGITLRTEMAVAFEDEPEVQELQRWFDLLWAAGSHLDLGQIATYMESLPEGRMAPDSERPPLFPHGPAIPARLMSLPDDGERGGRPPSIRNSGDGSGMSNDQNWEHERMLLAAAWAHGLKPGDTFHRHALIAYVRTHIELADESTLTERFNPRGGRSAYFEGIGERSGHYRLTEKGHDEAIRLWGPLPQRARCDCQWVFKRHYKDHHITIRVSPGRVLNDQHQRGQLEYFIDGQTASFGEIWKRLKELGALFSAKPHQTDVLDWIFREKDVSWERVTGTS